MLYWKLAYGYCGFQRSDIKDPFTNILYPTKSFKTTKEMLL
jgi:hypothetical protein